MFLNIKFIETSENMSFLNMLHISYCKSHLGTDIFPAAIKTYFNTNATNVLNKIFWNMNDQSRQHMLYGEVRLL